MLARILIVTFGIAVGAALSQAPEFVQQYTQRLGGRLDELLRFVQQFDQDAGRSGLTRPLALEEFGRSGSEFLTARGVDAQTMIARYERYAAHKADLDRAGPFARLAEFATGFEPDIAAATFVDYEPAVPLTSEGAVLAGGGFLGGSLIGALVLRAIRSRRRGPARA